MILRKINAVIGLITSALLLNHAVFWAVWMLLRGRLEKAPASIPWVLMPLMALHAVLSIAVLILGRRGSKGGKSKAYVKFNISSYVQRIAGVMMLALIGIHIIGAENHYHSKGFHAVFHPLFFAAALAHTALSVSKALITLGIGNAKVIRAVDRIMAAFCGVTLIGGVIGFYLCLFVGVVKV